ncbi:MAG TPA: SGNH/GDSL hydrolase family protein [Phycisphaerae bacterium]|nr:SGNH/GDSL hydrolase family protein [Phycisphaerae bacterium]
MTKAGAGLFAMVLALAGTPECREKIPLQVGAGCRIVAIGDSITRAGGYLRAMDAVFARQYPALKIQPIVNVGISGQKAEDLVKRFDKDVVRHKPDIVTISIGINDVWHRLKAPHDPKVLEAYEANLDEMVRMAQEAGIKVLLVAPTVIDEDPASEGNKRLATYVEAGKRVAKRRGCGYADLHALFLKAIESHKKEHPDAGPKGFLTSDGVHMKPPGDALMAVGILRAFGVPDEKIQATSLETVFPGRP